MPSQRPVSSPAFFHANQYVSLTVPQILGSSSAHRITRAHAMLAAHAPVNPADLLHIIGDQTDRSYPIYHDALSHKRGDLSDWTMCSALFDLRAGRLKVYEGNPVNGGVVAADVPLGDSD